MAAERLPSPEGPSARVDTELADLHSALTGQRRALFEALSSVGEARVGARLARCYLGAIAVLGIVGNPERHAQAGHSFRELMDMLPEAVDVPKVALRERLGDKGQKLENAWTSAKASACRNDETWQGEIDRPLKRFLAEAEDFYDWKAAHNPARRRETDEVLNELDVSGRPAPQALRSLNVDRWMLIREHFISAAHHRNEVNVAEFEAWVDELEREILNRLRPRTFETFDAIDDILQGEDSDAA